LAALGYRGLSMTASAIGPVKAALLAVDLAETRAFLMRMIETNEDGALVRQELKAFVERQGAPL
jgi:phosphotransferase system enzyme I (PtsP)